MKIRVGQVRRIVLVAVMTLVMCLGSGIAAAEPSNGAVSVGVTVLPKLDVRVTGDSVRVMSNTRWLLETGRVDGPEGASTVAVDAGEEVIVPITEFSTWTLIAE